MICNTIMLLQFSHSEQAAVSDPHLSAMNCLTQTVVLFSALSTEGLGGGGAGFTPIGHRDWMLDSAHLSPLDARAVILNLLLPLPAPFGVHAQDKQARNRLETVWSLSEIDKIGRWSFACLCTYSRKPAIGNGIFFALSSSNAFAHESPRSDKIFFQINAVKVFSSAVYQQTALLYRQVRQAWDCKLPNSGYCSITRQPKKKKCLFVSIGCAVFGNKTVSYLKI